MNHVQQHLADNGAGVIDAIWITKTLIGGPHALRDAKFIVLDHPARTRERAAHNALMDQADAMIDTISPSGEPAQPPHHPPGP